MTAGPRERAFRIVPVAGRIVVHIGAQMIADSIGALVLHEAGYAPVYYLPRADVRLDLAARSAHASHCPGKGDASYYSFPFAGDNGENVAWSYEDPLPDAAAIAGFVAFYRDRATIEFAAD